MAKGRKVNIALDQLCQCRSLAVPNDSTKQFLIWHPAAAWSQAAPGAGRGWAGGQTYRPSDQGPQHHLLLPIFDKNEKECIH